MKKFLLIAAVCSILMTAASCGNNADYEALKKENENLKAELEKRGGNAAANVADKAATNNNTNNANSLKEVGIGETVSVSTDKGDFEIQIDNVHKTDMYRNDPGTFAATVQCVVNNISFSGDIYKNTISGYEAAEENDYIQFADKDGIAYPFYSVSGPTDGAYAVGHNVPSGSKSRESYPFLVPDGTKDVSIIINHEYVVNTIVND